MQQVFVCEEDKQSSQVQREDEPLSPGHHTAGSGWELYDLGKPGNYCGGRSQGGWRLLGSCNTSLPSELGHYGDLVPSLDTVATAPWEEPGPSAPSHAASQASQAQPLHQHGAESAFPAMLPGARLLVCVYSPSSHGAVAFR